MTEKKEDCKDKKCPHHSNLRTRGRVFEGMVIAKDLHRSATIEFERIAYDKKYERYQRGTTRIRAHNPACINADTGDKVIISECRPLSKSKKFVITRKIGKDVLFHEKTERKRESLKRTQKISEEEKLSNEKRFSEQLIEEKGKID